MESAKTRQKTVLIVLKIALRADGIRSETLVILTVFVTAHPQGHPGRRLMRIARMIVVLLLVQGTLIRRLTLSVTAFVRALSAAKMKPTARRTALRFASALTIKFGMAACG